MHRGETFGSVWGTRLRALHLVEIRGCDARCQGEEPPKSGHISALKMVMHAHTPPPYHKAGRVDGDRKTVRGLLGLTSESFTVDQIERNQGGARLEKNDVTCGAVTAVVVFLSYVQIGAPHGEVFGSVWCTSW